MCMYDVNVYLYPHVSVCICVQYIKRKIDKSFGASEIFLLEHACNATTVVSAQELFRFLYRYFT